MKRDKYLAAGKKQLEKRDYARALLKFRNAAQAMPGDAEAYYQLGITSLAMGDFRGAISMLRKAIDLDPKHIGARVRLAGLMSTSRDTQDVERGRNDLEQVLAFFMKKPDEGRMSAWQTDNPSTTLQDFNSVAAAYYNPYSTPADGTIQTTFSGTSGSGNAGVYPQSSPDFGTGQFLAAGAASYNESGVYATSTEYYDYYSCGFFSCGWYSASNAPTGGGSYSNNQTASMRGA